eukprot:6201280-Pleurochrysis_carterae.AAC.17
MKWHKSRRVCTRRLFRHLKTFCDIRFRTAHPHPGTAAAETRSHTTTLAKDRYIESKRAYNVHLKKLFGLIHGHAIGLVILQESDITVIGNGKSAWAIRFQCHGHQSPRTSLTNIDDDKQGSSPRLSSAGVDKRTITKIVANINRINLERESTCQYSENKRLLTHPAQLATSEAQQKLQKPSYKNGNAPLLQLLVTAFHELWPHAFRNSMIRGQDSLQRSRGGHRAMHVNTASGVGDDASAADNNDMTKDNAARFAMFKASGMPASLEGKILCHNSLGWGHVATDNSDKPVCLSAV